MRLLSYVQIERCWMREPLASVIVVSDDLPEVLSICHRVIVMANGRVSHEEPVETLNLNTLVQEVTLES